MILFTAVRFLNIIYLLAFGATNLPWIVICVMSAIVLYGALLIVKKLIFGILLKDIMAFFIVQAVAVAFNLGYMLIIGFPLQLSLLEIIAVGTFLDILVSACVLYYGIKRMRRAAAAGEKGNTNV